MRGIEGLGSVFTRGKSVARRPRRCGVCLSDPTDSGPSIASTPRSITTPRSARRRAAAIPMTTSSSTISHPKRPPPNESSMPISCIFLLLYSRGRHRLQMLFDLICTNCW